MRTRVLEESPLAAQQVKPKTQEMCSKAELRIESGFWAGFGLFCFVVLGTFQPEHLEGQELENTFYRIKPAERYRETQLFQR